MMNCGCCFEVEFIEVEDFETEFEVGTVIGGGGGGYPQYMGPYSARPKVRDQVFHTDKTSMEDDFIVKKITYLETPNAGGGLTITIGET